MYWTGDKFFPAVDSLGDIISLETDGPDRVGDSGSRTVKMSFGVEMDSDLTSVRGILLVRTAGAR